MTRTQRRAGRRPQRPTRPDPRTPPGDNIHAGRIAGRPPERKTRRGPVGDGTRPPLATTARSYDVDGMRISTADPGRVVRTGRFDLVDLLATRWSPQVGRRLTARETVDGALLLAAQAGMPFPRASVADSPRPGWSMTARTPHDDAETPEPLGDGAGVLPSSARRVAHAEGYVPHDRHREGTPATG